MRDQNQAPSQPVSQRRQWGTELNRPPLPAVEKPASDLAMWLGGLAIVVTVAAWLIYMIITVIPEFIAIGIHDITLLLSTASYAVVMTLLTFSALMYLWARQGAMYRSRQHSRVPRALLDEHFAHSTTSMTVLVPSYCEDPTQVRTTLISAALQEFPSLRVVLLLDDPPEPSTDEARASLEGCRLLAGQVADWLSEPSSRCERALAALELLPDHQETASQVLVLAIADEFAWCSDWLLAESISAPRSTTAEEFVADQVLHGISLDFRSIAQALHAAAQEEHELPVARIIELQRQLTWTFRAELAVFERKLYASLSHDVNKAMNLNSYIGLMGSRYRVVASPEGRLLEPDPFGELDIPESQFVLTLDADSALLRDYCLRLGYFMEQPGNERIAISQTPYSAFRGARTRLERMAGATTDIQHLVHQGLTHHDATFWVGANAVIRKEALDDIVDVSSVGGREIRRYVQDRTVIEDTESSVDLISDSWWLYNYPERLSYSASPPDFGSLTVQRGRWANGGLLIIPKFWRLVRLRRREGQPLRFSEVALRMNYMGSIFWCSVSLLLLLTVPYKSALLSPLVFIAACPYFMAQSADFKRLGYKRTDVFRAYGFNLILLPVNLAGVLKSLQQAASKSKTPFARTPKVRNRTASPALYVLAIYFIIAFSIYTLRQDLTNKNWVNAAFAGVNATLTAYALIAFVGVRNSIVDVLLGMFHWIRVPAKAKPAAVDEGPAEWKSVLYFGPGEDAIPAHKPLMFTSNWASQAAQLAQPTELEIATDPKLDLSTLSLVVVRPGADPDGPRE